MMHNLFSFVVHMSQPNHWIVKILVSSSISLGLYWETPIEIKIWAWELRYKNIKIFNPCIVSVKCFIKDIDPTLFPKLINKARGY